MSRYTGPVCRLCKAEGVKLFLKGDRCFTEKCAITRGENKSKQKKGRPRAKMSEYGLRLREKQKLRRFYGMNEGQFRRLFAEASRLSGVTGHNFLQLLERRLDNVVYRMGLASSRNQARQIVLHGHITVNGRKVDIPSYLLRAGSVVAVAESSKDIALIRENAEVAASRTIPEWLEVNTERMEAKVISIPVREQIDVPVNEQLVVEFYAR
ncbi:30S ribosomal protein S4 [Aminobacterium sp. MB27-C1]|jgi:small subunit ribosomal protein S4|uniref:30S ribosomal protein S4 n=1 Tax=unclassified Aminobacterium TaxID=2685012 RepID=UPI001BCEFEC2|nr:MULTISPECIES: 30S ribosomal protein S4 [unclassified Aminobacterium]MEA4878046.1 30S ribosomal protein S4 [Aminobacterium sp.]WMI70611.1 30S ribosomal protein S4 [Aminobacterium sp. MB27-C1]